MIKKLKLINFRNIDSAELSFDPYLNVFYGLNGQGKTNIVESIAYLSLLKSFRGSESSSLIMEGKEFASIEITDDKNDKYKVVISKTEGKQTFLNDKKIKKRSDYISLLNVVTFAPENVDMFKDSPKIRRDFLDDELCMLFPAYSQYYNNYEKARIERNNCLKEQPLNEALIETYNALLSNYGYCIVQKRNDFVEKIKKGLQEYYKKLSATDAEITVEYISDFKGINSEKEILNKYQNSLNQDIERGQTLLGPHKDDLNMYLNGKDISQFGSQGQNRIAVIALKLATIELIHNELNKECVVILDDVLSELDGIRKNKLLDILNYDNQLFITTTERIMFKRCKKFVVKDGKVGG